jgi:lauroyl/myristoyl acyltransferase
LQLVSVVEREDTLARSLAENDRLILCTGHFGLGLLIFRVIADYLNERGYPVCFIVKYAKVFDEVWRVGMRGSVSLSTIGANTFIKARSALETGSIVCVAPDHLTEEGHEVSTNVFNFAWRLRASVLFLGSRLDRDGRIVIDFVRPFHHTIKTHNETVMGADEFRQFVAKRTGRTVKLSDRT